MADETNTVNATFTLSMDADALVLAESSAANMGMNLQQIVKNLILRIAYDKTVPFKIQVPKNFPVE